MKTLPDKVIIYDNNCPMCSLYTKGFVEWGLLEKQNRISFTDLHTTTLSCELDLNRARHEIP
jgi:predicted DCC family thiol-disulfide oxidoreductase YuxK